MSRRPAASAHPEVVLYRRNVAKVTTVPLLHEQERAEKIAALGRRDRKTQLPALEAEWREAEAAARTDAQRLLAVVRDSTEELAAAVEALAAAKVPELAGKVEVARQHVGAGRAHLQLAEEALQRAAFDIAGQELDDASRELHQFGPSLVIALNRVLPQTPMNKEQRATFTALLERWESAKESYERARNASPTELARVAAELRREDAAVYLTAAKLLGSRRPSSQPKAAKAASDTTIAVVQPHECETFAEVGGLADVKSRLRDTIGVGLERPDDAERYGISRNGVLFYGPPGTGKNLLSRALAGEYGLRYLRFSPHVIGSALQHETAANLRRVFEAAKAQAPCVLYLDEIDTIASDRGDQPSAEHREVVTQLMVCLEEFRSVPGLVIVAATNSVDRLDPALREGRFDVKIQVPLPDAAARADILRVHLRRRSDAVDWDAVDVDETATASAGYNAAALEGVVSASAELALQEGGLISQKHLAEAMRQRSGQHRLTLDRRVGWEDVVLADPTREHLQEVMTVFTRPDLARSLGVTAPAGLLLYGPPGTGKTTIARAMASQLEASFYEVSAAELLSKWAGESEQRVAKLFSQARANRPAVVFIDEIDALLRRRTDDTSAKWEERVLSQFLAELDGLRSGEGVLLVGATNRIDVIDDAIVGRRLVPVEVGLPDDAGRHEILRVLCQDAQLHSSVDLEVVARATPGSSGADLKRLRDRAGMRALTRAANSGDDEAATITQDDFDAAIATDRNKATLLSV